MWRPRCNHPVPLDMNTLKALKLIVCAVVAIGATLTTLVTMLVLGNILREIAIETFDSIRVWWAG